MALLTQLVAQPNGSRAPLMLEVPVPPGLDGPFLVTSSRDLLWVSKAFPNGNLRAAVRRVSPGDLFLDLLCAVERRSREEGWGSAHPPTASGVAGAVAHLSEYGLNDVEVVFRAGFDESLVPAGVPSRKVEWVPVGWAAALPVDRSFVGTTFDFGGGQYATLLHNASRGVGIVSPGEQ